MLRSTHHLPSLRPTALAAILACTIALPSVAQTVTPPAASASAPAGQPVAPAAASATPREPEAALDQVVVTVQRRKEAAQSVPLSISALSGEQMKTPT